MMYTSLYVAIACVFLVAVHGSDWQDDDPHPCFDGMRRICIQCDHTSDKFFCQQYGRYQVCKDKDSQCQYWEKNMKKARCKEKRFCYRNCGKGIEKKCGFNNSQSLPNWKFCDNEYTICETKQMKLKWQLECPEGTTRNVQAMWGRLRGDKETCNEGIKHSSMGYVCKYNADLSKKALEKQCEGKVDSDGMCTIQANVEAMGMYDPCRNRYKYIKVCISCVPTVAKVLDQSVLVLLDVSDSFWEKTKSHLPKVSRFLEMFITVTASAIYYKTSLHVARFDTRLLVDKDLTLSYGGTGVENHMVIPREEAKKFGEFIAIIQQKRTGLTNIGQSLLDAQKKYKLDKSWIILVVSDFINVIEKPTIASVLDQYKRAGLDVHPVLVDKPTIDEPAYNAFKASTIGKVGFDLRAGFPASQIKTLYEGE